VSREREARRERGEREISILFCYNVGPSTSYVAEKVVRLCEKMHSQKLVGLVYILSIID